MPPFVFLGKMNKAGTQPAPAPTPTVPAAPAPSACVPCRGTGKFYPFAPPARFGDPRSTVQSQLACNACHGTGTS